MDGLFTGPNGNTFGFNTFHGILFGHYITRRKDFFSRSLETLVKWYRNSLKQLAKKYDRRR